MFYASPSHGKETKYRLIIFSIYWWKSPNTIKHFLFNKFGGLPISYIFWWVKGGGVGYWIIIKENIISEYATFNINKIEDSNRGATYSIFQGTNTYNFNGYVNFCGNLYRVSPYALLILPKCYRNHNATFAIDRTILSCHKIL